ncbi:hypothetical protein H6F75_00100 [Nodosilinea sp. FACHB-131]|uniref:hypothetical protein n=1 Tax=Cyanophyceae TaxID=3028117 RepID=UPI0016837B07|nr:hypothetical protein [Nodosilinea sp. FACHB-131]MBD1871871.1 hypothetical protein [Nodosilinea sp. FACHB-131]
MSWAVGVGEGGAGLGFGFSLSTGFSLSWELSLDLSVMVTNVVKEQTNVALIYDYAREMYFDRKQNLRSLDTRLATAIGFAGLTLRFAAELPELGLVEPRLKVAACGLAALATVVALKGFVSQASGEVMRPDALLEKFYYDSDEQCRLVIVRQWQSASDALSHLAAAKSYWLNRSVILLVLAALSFGADVVLAVLS